MNRSQAEMLDRSMPAAAHAGLGSKLADLIDQFNNLRAAVAAIYPGSSWVVTAATLAKEAAHKKVETVGAFRAVVGGTVVTKAAGTDMPTLATDELAAGKVAAYYFDVVANGTVTCAVTSAEDSVAEAIAAIPAVADNTVRIGYLVVENGTEAAFVGNTTALNATGITTTYVNTPAVPALTATAVATLT
jgi:hypothetical protein